jgi:hypothetical protein
VYLLYSQHVQTNLREMCGVAAGHLYKHTVESIPLVQDLPVAADVQVGLSPCATAAVQLGCSKCRYDTNKGCIGCNPNHPLQEKEVNGGPCGACKSHIL